MAEAKPFASLSSGLLARKGAAKPAMRPQGFGQMGMGLEDLGWNDMGHAPSPAPQYEPEHVPSSIAALTPAPRHNGHSNASEEPRASEAKAEPDVAPVPVIQPQIAPPPVVEQQRAVEAAFAEAAKPAARPARARATVGRTRTAPGIKGKAAFTLRLDPDRHLQLRLACAVTHRSAQQIVTEALDEFLESRPEIGAIARQVPAKAGGKSN